MEIKMSAFLLMKLLSGHDFRAAARWACYFSLILCSELERLTHLVGQPRPPTQSQSECTLTMGRMASKVRTQEELSHTYPVPSLKIISQVSQFYFWRGVMRKPKEKRGSLTISSHLLLWPVETCPFLSHTVFLGPYRRVPLHPWVHKSQALISGGLGLQHLEAVFWFLARDWDQVAAVRVLNPSH